LALALLLLFVVAWTDEASRVRALRPALKWQRGN
jgi:hypothetical protein